MLYNQVKDSYIVRIRFYCYASN